MLKTFLKKMWLNKIIKSLKYNKDFICSITNNYNNFFLEISETEYNNYWTKEKKIIEKNNHEKNKQLSEMNIKELKFFYKEINDYVDKNGIKTTLM